MLWYEMGMLRFELRSQGPKPRRLTRLPHIPDLFIKRSDVYKYYFFFSADFAAGFAAVFTAVFPAGVFSADFAAACGAANLVGVFSETGVLVFAASSAAFAA